MTIEDDIKDRLIKGLINNDLEPIRCVCGGQNYNDVPIDSLDNLVVEIDRICLECYKIMGYWSYGYWMP